MAILHLEGFDTRSTQGTAGTQDTLAYLRKRYSGTFTGGNGPVVYDGRHGGDALSLSPDGYADQNSVMFPLATPVQSVYVGMAVKPNVRDSTGTLLAFWNTRNNITHDVVAMRTPRTLGVYRTASLSATNELGYADIGARQNTWFYLEVYILIHDSTGAVTVRINGSNVISVTNVDTRNGGYENLLTHVTLMSPINYANDYYNNWLFDDLYVSDSGFLGPIHIESVSPDGAGASSNFTPLSGSNYEMVDDAFGDGDTTYNESANTPGNLDLFTAGNITDIDTDIKAVKVEVTARITDAGRVPLMTKVKSGTTEGDGTTEGVISDEDYQMVDHIFETDPDTSSAWTVSGVNGVQIGYEVG